MVGSRARRCSDVRFGAVLLSGFCSLLAQEMLQFVLPLYLLEQTGSAASFGFVVAMGFIPYALLAPVGGALADRGWQRRLMVGVNVMLMGALGVFFAMMGRVAPFAVVALVTIASFVAQALYQPAVQSCVPYLLQGERVLRGAALMSEAGTITTLIGPVVGAFILGIAGIAAVAVISLVLFCIAAMIAVVFVRIDAGASDGRVSDGIVPALFGDVVEAMRYVRDRPQLMGGICSGTLINLLVGSLLSVGTSYLVLQVLHLDALYTSYAQMAFGVGALAGGALLAARPRAFSAARIWRYELAMALPVLGLAVVFALVGASAVGWPWMNMAAFAALIGAGALAMACGTIASTCITADLQREAPREMVGKLVALFMTLVNCATPIGQAVYGVALDTAEPACLLLFAGLSGVAVALGLRWFTKTRR